MTKVISLKDRLEIWKRVYEKDALEVYVSNQGRFKIKHLNSITVLEFFDSIFFLKHLSESLEIMMLDMKLFKSNL